MKKQFTLGANKKVNFVRIPKNASTSLYNFFGATNTIRDEYLHMPKAKYQGLFAPSHCTLQEATDQLGEKILELPTLAVYRNPYERAVSFYCFALKYNLFRFYNLPKLSFLEFCKVFSSQDGDFFHAWSQKKYLQTKSKKEIHILKQDRLEKDLWLFLEKYDLADFYRKAGKKLKHENQTGHKAFGEFYCSESKKIIEDLWLDDFNSQYLV